MNMKILKSEKRLCTCCMEEHIVKTVLVKETTTFKNVLVKYDACYMYCDAADEFYADEDQLRDNDIRLKNAYRRQEGLLTSDEISAIREKYSITQSDLCTLLGWGGKTITRYESHQVQDKAHDTILKKINNDPEWFISLLNDAKNDLSDEAYHKSLDAAMRQYKAVVDSVKEEGRKEGEGILAKLINKLLSLGKNDDAMKATTDAKYRESLYMRYGIK